MQVFWSWQNDTPAQIGRHFVRNALDAAIQQLEIQPPCVVEPNIRDRRSFPETTSDGRLRLDNLDPARGILEQIGESVVFIADITPTAVSASSVSTAAASPTFINTDVSIELGCALGLLGKQRTLMVMNEHYGDLPDLPFHLQEKEHLITFNLAPSTDDQTALAKERHLTIQLVEFINSAIAVARQRKVRGEFGSFITARVNRTITAAHSLVIGLGLLTIRRFIFAGLLSLSTINVDSFLWYLTFWLYFISWIFGVTFDKNRELDTFVEPKNKNTVPWTDLSLVFIIAILFSTIAAVEQVNEPLTDIYNFYVSLFGGDWVKAARVAYRAYGLVIFLAMVNLLWAINYLLWRYFLGQYIENWSTESEKVFATRRDIAAQDKLRILRAYITGQWQNRRFIVGGGYLIVLDILVAVSWARQGWTSFVASPVHYILMSGFVIGVESWIWFERAKMWCRQTSVDDMADRFWFIRRVSMDDDNSAQRTTIRSTHNRRRRKGKQ
jgi:hypothetical protein